MMAFSRKTSFVEGILQSSKPITEKEKTLISKISPKTVLDKKNLLHIIQNKMSEAVKYLCTTHGSQIDTDLVVEAISKTSSNAGQCPAIQKETIEVLLHHVKPGIESKKAWQIIAAVLNRFVIPLDILQLCLEILGHVIDPNDQTQKHWEYMSPLAQICALNSKQSARVLEVFLAHYSGQIDLANGHGTNVLLAFDYRNPFKMLPELACRKYDANKLIIKHHNGETSNASEKLEVFCSHLEAQLNQIDASLIFRHAVTWKDDSALEKFLEIFGKDVDPNKRDENGCTPLWHLCESVTKQLQNIRFRQSYKCSHFCKKLELLKHFFGIKAVIESDQQHGRDRNFASSNTETNTEDTLDNNTGYRSENNTDNIHGQSQNPVDPNIPAKNKQTPLGLLVNSKFFDLVNEFLQQLGSHIDVQVSSNYEALLEAMGYFLKRNDTESLSFFRSENMDPIISDSLLLNIIKPEYSDNSVKEALDVFSARMNPDVQATDTGETAAHRAARQRPGRKLALIHNAFKERYNPSIQDNTGNTVLMCAFCEYDPDFIKLLLDHPKMDLTLRNKYEQDIMDLIKHKPYMDPRTKKLVEVAYHKQKRKLARESLCNKETISYHIQQLQNIVDCCDAPRTSKETLKSHLESFSELFDNVMHGRNPGNIGMSIKHRRILQGRRVMLLEELQPTGSDLLDHLYEDETLNLDQLDEIKACQTRRKCAEKLLSILPFCGEKAYDSFVNALRKTNKGYIADALEDYDPDSTSEKELDRSPQDTAVVPAGGIANPALPYGTNVAAAVAVPLPVVPNNLTLSVTLYNNTTHL